ncbi:MAG: hypothetical protein AAB412_04830, partial [Elusimicrobiota bacterium]
MHETAARPQNERPPAGGTLSILLRRRWLAVKNRVLSMTRWEWGRNTAFVLMGLWMLSGLHYGFWRLLVFLDGVELIGDLLLWKLTAMALLTTFGMVTLSSLIISLTTLFYASDLPFLLREPVRLRLIFLDKSLEAAFFSSWMIALALFPYVLALGRVKGLGLDFYAVFFVLLLPFLLLAASIGMAITLLLMYLFPSSRTRDVLWVLSSLSVALIYVLLRLSQPEQLVRPDAMKAAAAYLGFLQAPTAPYSPSWWLTQALSSFVHGNRETFLRRSLEVCAAAAAAYGGLLWLAGRMYARGYSGAQECRRARRSAFIPVTPESRLAAFLGRGRTVAVLYWKERTTFFRDVKHWSQMVLIGALLCVYLFSINRLPLDTPDLKSLVCFLNIAIAGFVLSSLGLRFTFPSISLEGKSWWILRSAPVTIRSVMLEKFLFSILPMTGIATALVALSNHLLQSGRFIGSLSLVTIWVSAWALCAMVVGLGAVFPRFRVENIHQIESSAGGFVYMACALAYIAFAVATEAIPVRMYFQSRLGQLNAWDPGLLLLSLAAFLLVNAAGIAIPWALG